MVNTHFFAPSAGLVRGVIFSLMSLSCVGIAQTLHGQGFAHSAVPLSTTIPVSNGGPVEPWLYAVDDGGNDGSSTLYRIGTVPAGGTVALETIGETGIQDVFDIAFRGDILVGVAAGTSFNIQDDVLIEINRHSGVATAIGRIDIPGHLNALETETATTVLAATTAGELWRIDFNVLQIIRVGSFGSGLLSSGDLAIAKDGSLMATISGSPSDLLAVIDQSTGSAGIVGSTGYDDVYGLATHQQSGALLAVVDAVSAPKLATIDRYSAAATLIGTIPSSRPITGLAARPTIVSIAPNFSWTPEAPRLGQEVVFTDLSSDRADAWQWTFGDGRDSSERNSKHIFASAGTFSVTLQVSRKGESPVSVTKAVYISNDPSVVVIAGSVSIDTSARIRGGGTQYRREVQVLDAENRRIIGRQDIDENGDFAIIVPPGIYTAFASIEYANDTADIDSVATEKVHTERPCDGTALCNLTFPNPVVFIHGLQIPTVDGRERWTRWRENLPAEVIAFVPNYSAADSAEQGAAAVTKDLERSFEMFSESPSFDIIAHSKGGLVARVLKAQGRYSDRIDSAALLGTPNDGANCLTDGFVGLSRCDLEDFNARFPTFPGNVFVVAGTAGVPCLGNNDGPSDGLVPVDSVFKITHRDTNVASGVTFPGVIVPLRHTELGVIEPWLLEDVILPAFRGGDLSSCPETPYETPFVRCSERWPVPNPCMAGRGLRSNLKCNIPSPEEKLGVRLTWRVPVGVLSPPSGIGVTIGWFSACSEDPGTNSFSATDTGAGGTGEQVDGYFILRSALTKGQFEEPRRIGFVPTAATAFVDDEPLPGTSQYWIVAVYRDAQSSPEPSRVVFAPSRRRSVRNSH